MTPVPPRFLLHWFSPDCTGDGRDINVTRPHSVQLSDVTPLPFTSSGLVHDLCSSGEQYIKRGLSLHCQLPSLSSVPWLGGWCCAPAHSFSLALKSRAVPSPPPPHGLGRALGVVSPSPPPSSTVEARAARGGREPERESALSCEERLRCRCCEMASFCCAGAAAALKAAAAVPTVGSGAEG